MSAPTARGRMLSDGGLFDSEGMQDKVLLINAHLLVQASDSFRQFAFINHSGITRQMLSDTRQRPCSGQPYHSGYHEAQAAPEASK